MKRLYVLRLRTSSSPVNLVDKRTKITRDNPNSIYAKIKAFLKEHPGQEFSVNEIAHAIHESTRIMNVRETLDALISEFKSPIKKRSVGRGSAKRVYYYYDPKMV